MSAVIRTSLAYASAASLVVWTGVDAQSLKPPSPGARPSQSAVANDGGIGINAGDHAKIEIHQTINNRDPAVRKLVDLLQKNQRDRASSEGFLRQELTAARKENQELQKRLRDELTNAIAEILWRAKQQGPLTDAARAKTLLESGDPKSAEQFLGRIEQEAVARQDLHEAARIARQLGGLAATRSVTLAAAAFRRAAGYEPQNSENWNLLGELWRRSADLGEAEFALKQLVNVLMLSAKNESDYVAKQRNVANAYRRLGDVYAFDGKPKAATGAYRSGVKVLTALAQQSSTGKPVLNDLAAMYAGLGDGLRLDRDPAGGIEAYRKASSLYSGLTSEEQSHPSVATNIGNLHRKMGFALLHSGNKDAALQAFRRSQEIFRRLVDETRSEFTALEGLSRAQRGVGDALRATGDFVGAGSAFKASLETTRAVVARDSNDTLALQELGLAYEKIGDVSRDQADVLQAVRAFDKSLAINAGLVLRNPKRIPWQYSKLRVNEKLANAMSAYGVKDQAIAAYRTNLAIHAELGALLKSSGTPTERRDQAKWLDQLGQALWTLGDQAGSLDAYRRSMTIREDLLALSPDSTVAQLDIVQSCWYIGRQPRSGSASQEELERHLSRGLSLLQQLRAKGKLPENLANWEQQFDATLQGLTSGVPQTAQRKRRMRSE